MEIIGMRPREVWEMFYRENAEIEEHAVFLDPVYIEIDTHE